MKMKEIGPEGVSHGSANAYHLSELDLVFDQSLDELGVVLEVNVVWKHAEKWSQQQLLKYMGVKNSSALILSTTNCIVNTLELCFFLGGGAKKFQDWQEQTHNTFHNATG